MSLFEDVMSLAVQMPISERERLARALGLSVHTKGPGKSLPLNQFVSQPNPQSAAAWRKSETGHAVVDTAAPISDSDIPTGPPAIAGIWPATVTESGGDAPLASSLPLNSPVIVHTSVCVELAEGKEEAIAFWKALPVEARLATATYITLLGGATDETQLRRLQKFVQPFAVLSLGPMASSRAVELMLTHHIEDGLEPLDALIAATALAHEIPLVTTNPAPFLNVMGLKVYRPY